MGSAWIFWFLLEKQKLENLCHEYVLKSQETLIGANNQVLNLNPRAWALITEKNTLYATILTAPPPVAAAASARLKVVIAQQHILQRLQKGILFTSHILTRKQAYELQTKMRRNFFKIEKYWQSRPTFSNIEIYWQSSQLTPQFKEIAPPYKRSQDHSYRQQLHVKWSYPLKNILPDWLTHLISFKHSWDGECSSQPVKNQYHWMAKLKKIGRF